MKKRKYKLVSRFGPGHQSERITFGFTTKKRLTAKDKEKLQEEEASKVAKERNYNTMTTFYWVR